MLPAGVINFIALHLIKSALFKVREPNDNQVTSGGFWIQNLLFL